MSNRPIQVTDNAQAQLSAGINASSTTFLLGSGEGATFPETIVGQATSAGDQTTLNSTGIESQGLDRSMWIYNKTQDAAAKVVSVGTNVLTTTRLIDRDGNYVSWGAADEYVVRPFVMTMTNWSGTPFEGDPVKMEKVLILQRTADTLNAFSSGNRGYSGTTSQSFASTDFVTVFVEQETFFETWIALGELAEKKADDDKVIHLAGTEQIMGPKTFSVAPTSDTPATLDNHLIRKKEATEISGAAVDVTLATTLIAGQPYTFDADGDADELDVADSGYTESIDTQSVTNVAYDPVNNIYVEFYPTSIRAFTIDFNTGNLTLGSALALTVTDYSSVDMVFDEAEGKIVLIGVDNTSSDLNMTHLTINPSTLAITLGTKDTVYTTANTLILPVKSTVYDPTNNAVLIGVNENTINKSRVFTAVFGGVSWTATNIDLPDFEFGNKISIVHDRNNTENIVSWYNPQATDEILAQRLSYAAGVSALVGSALTLVAGAVVDGTAILRWSIFDNEVYTFPVLAGITPKIHILSNAAGVLSIDTGESVTNGQTMEMDTINKRIAIDLSSGDVAKYSESAGSYILKETVTGDSSILTPRGSAESYHFMAGIAVFSRQTWAGTNNLNGFMNEGGTVGQVKSASTLYVLDRNQTDMISGKTQWLFREGVTKHYTGIVAGLAYSSTALLVLRTVP